MKIAMGKVPLKSTSFFEKHFFAVYMKAVCIVRGVYCQERTCKLMKEDWKLMEKKSLHGIVKEARNRKK